MNRKLERTRQTSEKNATLPMSTKLNTERAKNKGKVRLGSTNFLLKADSSKTLHRPTLSNTWLAAAFTSILKT